MLKSGIRSKILDLFVESRIEYSCFSHQPTTGLEPVAVSRDMGMLYLKSYAGRDSRCFLSY